MKLKKDTFPKPCWLLLRRTKIFLSEGIRLGTSSDSYSATLNWLKRNKMAGTAFKITLRSKVWLSQNRFWLQSVSCSGISKFMTLTTQPLISQFKITLNGRNRFLLIRFKARFLICWMMEAFTLTTAETNHTGVSAFTMWTSSKTTHMKKSNLCTKQWCTCYSLWLTTAAYLVK